MQADCWQLGNGFWTMLCKDQLDTNDDHAPACRMAEGSCRSCLGEDCPEQVLSEVHDDLLVRERHLQVDLAEAGLAVAPRGLQQGSP